MDDNSSNAAAIVLIGGGFAGLTTALALSRSKYRSPIILIEPRHRFVFLPLLYELLSGELQAWEVAPFYKDLLANKGIVWIQDYARNIDIDKKVVITGAGQLISYSDLVLGTGSKPNTYGIKGVLNNTLRFNEFEDVQILKELILKLNTLNHQKKSLVIVGAGASGVELACKVADLVKENVQIHLVDSGERVLANGKSFNQEQVEKALNKKSIQLHLQSNVLEIDSESVFISSMGEKPNDVINLKHDGVIWNAGVKPFIPFEAFNDSSKDGRVLVDSYLKVLDMNDIFAAGDIAFDGNTLSKGTAQVAIQQGEFLADGFMASVKRKTHKPFEFIDRGEMLSLGIGEATITGLGITLAGPRAFQLRRMIYLSKMPSLSLGMRSASSWFLGNIKHNWLT